MRLLLRHCICLSSIALSSIAMAKVELHASCWAGASYCGTLALTDPTPGNHTLSASSGNAYWTSNGTATVRGDYGSLGAAVTATVTGTRIEDNGDIIISGGTAMIYADAHFNDTLLVVSKTLAKGAPVDIRFSGRVHGAIAQPEGSLGNHIRAAAWLIGDWHIETSSLYGDSTIVADERCIGRGLGETCAAGPNSFGDYAFIVSTRVGETVTLWAGLSAGLNAGIPQSFEGNYYSQTSFANALNSMTMFAAPIDVGVNLIAQSGHNYAAPVPEPATWAIAIGGVLGLLAVVRRRNRPAKNVVKRPCSPLHLNSLDTRFSAASLSSLRRGTSGATKQYIGR